MGQAAVLGGCSDICSVGKEVDMISVAKAKGRLDVLRGRLE
eukprot:CAMPEP_0204153374 /NCGR_PEP_ID=MMETSP0361-20130328/27797_1 /ASSEMBLY_ACC=CAM_ASM_000343 /TAXON_ID=268821 /ORGANISM="Scrippsiella Hangoei, Strain SHTV-5" /LENGTH=40 /DNA_ID= /DNA_START= /DNA_END= /DNA_ORIENTATION=